LDASAAEERVAGKEERVVPLAEQVSRTLPRYR
jgi:hypothetical protein